MNKFLAEMSWAKYLEDVKDVSSGCAVISLQGAVCVTEGLWEALPSENLAFADLFKVEDISTIIELHYNEQEFSVITSSHDQIVAISNEEKLILQKGELVFIAAIAKLDRSEDLPLYTSYAVRSMIPSTRIT